MNIPLMNSLRARVGVAIAACCCWSQGRHGPIRRRRVVRLAYTNGPVSFLPAGDNDWVQARINRPLWTGDQLWTAGGARAELQMGNAALRLAPETSLSVVNFDDRTEQFQVNQGPSDLQCESRRRGGDRDRHAESGFFDPQPRFNTVSTSAPTRRPSP